MKIHPKVGKNYMLVLDKDEMAQLFKEYSKEKNMGYLYIFEDVLEGAVDKKELPV